MPTDPSPPVKFLSVDFVRVLSCLGPPGLWDQPQGFSGRRGCSMPSALIAPSGEHRRHRMSSSSEPTVVPHPTPPHSMLTPQWVASLENFSMDAGSMLRVLPSPARIVKNSLLSSYKRIEGKRLPVPGKFPLHSPLYYISITSFNRCFFF